jgi:2-dehydro-3-deoxyphosphogluconate aldolase / (4S)-4-hydroxy-2-oxoglutarate aldolase
VTVAVMGIVDRIEASGVVAVVNPPPRGAAGPLATVLCEAGVPAIEITFRAEGAAAAIAEIAGALPEALVGAGTVLTVRQAAEALDAGAQFVVSPGTNPAVVEYVLGRGAVMLPGIATPSEIELNLALGIDVMKAFPAELIGGVRFLRALSGPYQAVRFVPTGGINARNLAEYLALPNVLAVGGSWIAPPDLVAAGDFVAIGELARVTAGLVRIATGLGRRVSGRSALRSDVTAAERAIARPDGRGRRPLPGP